mmetsp:Transcript_10187/g.28818  ORF Transcript_10187/g.28818 Transcript_10187/m.28818 type:complete len:227 (+) Transcript_10187:2960-3640(+)
MAHAEHIGRSGTFVAALVISAHSLSVHEQEVLPDFEVASQRRWPLAERVVPKPPGRWIPLVKSVVVPAEQRHNKYSLRYFCGAHVNPKLLANVVHRSHLRDGIRVHLAIARVPSDPQVVVPGSEEDSPEPLLELFQAYSQRVHGVPNITSDYHHVIGEVLVAKLLEPSDVAMLIDVHVTDAKHSGPVPRKVGVHLKPLQAPAPPAIEAHVGVPDRNQGKEGRHAPL